MKVTDIQYSLKNKKVKLSAQLSLKKGKTHHVYFEVDEEFKEHIAKDANPFLAASLPIAMKKNEDLEIDGIVSKNLLTNSVEIMKVLKSWNLGFTPILIHAKSDRENSKNTKNVGCFFSGGVDSFYTYLKNKNKISYLIFVHGFDIKADDVALYKKIEKNIASIAKKEKIRLIRVKTNVRQVFDQYFDWVVSHEFAIATVALFLGNGFKEIYASCGLQTKDSDHHYMVPELDPLWSTESMKIVHWGCDAGKIDKLTFLPRYQIAMENLRVCWVNKNREYNCCECEKCFRNMLALYVSGSLDKCKTFDKVLNLEKLKNTRVDEHVLKYFTAILDELKLKSNVTDVRYALEEFVINNKFPKFQQRVVRSVRDFFGSLDKKYNRNRLYWYLSRQDLI